MLDAVKEKLKTCDDATLREVIAMNCTLLVEMDNTIEQLTENYHKIALQLEKVGLATFKRHDGVEPETTKE